MPRDIFEEDPFGLDFADDAGDVGPQVPLVVGSPALAGVAERLAGIACEDGIECPSEWSPVKCSQVVPDRGRGEVSGPLGGNDGLPGILFPLDEASGVEPGLGEHEAHIKATGSGAEAKSVSGTNTHVIPSPSRAPRRVP